MKTSKNELSHGINHETNDKSNEPVESSSTTTKGQQKYKLGGKPINSSMLQMLRDGTLLKKMSKLVY